MSDTPTSYGVYIVVCADNTYYTGLTNNLSARVKTHNRGKGARYTRSRLPVTVLFWLDGFTRQQAYRVEYYIKTLNRSQKKRLIGGDKSLLALVQQSANDIP